MQFKHFFIFILLFINSVSFASTFDTSISVNLGIIPNMGNNLSSYYQKNDLNIENGIYGINRSKSGLTTSTIKPLTGTFIGTELKGTAFDYLILSIGINYGQSILTGSGTSLDNSDNIMSVSYSMWLIDIPITAGISISFWEDTKVSFQSGIAFSYGNYKNSFTSSTVNQNGSFKGLGTPIITKITGEYYISKNITISSSLSRYKGATQVLKNNNDYAKIDFSGYRFSFGASYYFKTEKEIKK